MLRTHRPDLRQVQRQQHLVGHVGLGQRGHPERRLQLVGGRWLAAEHEVDDAVLLVLGQAEDPGQAQRPGDPLLDGVAVVLPGELFDQLGQHPVGRGGVLQEATPAARPWRR
jgi:hypothetical protein